jgi:hypothetical protein
MEGEADELDHQPHLVVHVVNSGNEAAAIPGDMYLWLGKIETGGSHDPKELIFHHPFADLYPTKPFDQGIAYRADAIASLASHAVKYPSHVDDGYQSATNRFTQTTGCETLAPRDSDVDESASQGRDTNAVFDFDIIINEIGRTMDDKIASANSSHCHRHFDSPRPKSDSMQVTGCGVRRRRGSSGAEDSHRNRSLPGRSRAWKQIRPR